MKNMLSKNGFASTAVLVAFVLAFLGWKDELLAQTSGVWSKSSTLVVQGHKILVPSYLPYESKLNGKRPKCFWSSNNQYAKWPNYYFNFDIEKGCEGNHNCNFDSYSVTRINDQVLGVLDNLLTDRFTEVQLNADVTGYYVPGKCMMFCQKTFMYWVNDGKLYALGIKFPADKKQDLEEFKKSALTVLSH